MEAYLFYGDNWKTVIGDVKAKINTNMPWFDNLCQLYAKEDENKVLGRIKRIVREETKVQAMLYQNTSNTKTQTTDHHHGIDMVVDAKPKNTHRDGADSVAQRQMRYAEKKTPEERSKRKFDSFVDSESEESSDNEAEATLTPVKKKKQPSQREVNYQAQIAHTSMCEKASASLELMNNVLRKQDNKLDEL